MPYQTEMMYENRLLYVTLTDPLTLDDLMNSARITHETYQHASSPILTISDATKVTRLPPQVLSVVRGNKDVALDHPMRGLAVIITSNVFLSSMASVWARLAPKGKFRIVNTAEQAWAIINPLLKAAPPAPSDTPDKSSPTA